MTETLGSRCTFIRCRHMLARLASMLRGRRVTGFWAIQIDLQNAGASVTDEPCVVDGNLITGRFPFDLPRCLAAFEGQLAGYAQR